MPTLAPADRDFAAAVSRLAFCNPFLPERIEHERAALGSDFDARLPAWNLRPDAEALDPNVQRLCRRAEEVLARARPRRPPGRREDADPLGDLALFRLYHQFRDQFDRLIERALSGEAAPRADFYAAFTDQAQRDGLTADLPHIFACLFQIRRAFRNIFHFIIGSSRPAVRLRAAVWQSIFTHDMRRYRRSLFQHMADFTTLVAGPSGTGKELVARAVGLSRYIPFDPRGRTFAESFAGSFHPLNLSALSPTLIESELFGHKRGSFTGAVADRTGWLEVCSPCGSVFLDEVGELDPAIQVKLLRVLQTRGFTRLGETRPRPFHGKIIAATNRDMAAQMQQGLLREDFYYRLCSDIIVTPSLRERLEDDPQERRRLVVHIARRLAGDEAQTIADEVEERIDRDLGKDYPWPGNVRELEQAVRNVIVRRSYQPPRPAAVAEAEQLARDLEQGRLTAEQLLCRYCALVYAQCGTYEETARRLGLDRRTVKARLKG